MELITIENITIEVQRKNIKNLHLAVYPATGKVRISVPRKMSDETMHSFILSKLRWIHRHQAKHNNRKHLPPKEFINQEIHEFMGNNYSLNIVERKTSPTVMLSGTNAITMYVRANSTVAKRKAILYGWYRTELKKIIPPLIAFWEKKMNVTVEEWNIKLMKTKWGTCNTRKKRIWINLELAKKPVHILEYIIVHEMVHLFERRHNDRFYAYMHKFLPDWKQRKKELNKLQPEALI